MPDLNKLSHLICVLSLLWGVSAFAVDGVLEINQACAVNSGCFDGDTAGFPVFINSSGSYRLTSNLRVPDENTNAILGLPHVSDVTIDLNGFTIEGVTVCTGAGATINCTPTGAGKGVSASGENFTVINGTIRGVGSSGVELHDHARVERVRVIGNGGRGINVDDSSDVSDCTAIWNGSSGIDGRLDTRFARNIVVGNGGQGIFSARNSLAMENVSRGNGGSGIFLISSGIAIGNTIEENNGLGLFMESNGGYANNVITNNAAGTVSVAAVEMGTNVCDGDTTCP